MATASSLHFDQLIDTAMQLASYMLILVIFYPNSLSKVMQSLTYDTCIKGNRNKLYGMTHPPYANHTLRNGYCFVKIDHKILTEYILLYTVFIRIEAGASISYK